MKIIFGIFGILVIAAGFGIIFMTGAVELTAARKLEPQEVVQRYCEISESGDYEKIKDYTTNYPREYFEALTKEVELYKQASGELPAEKKPVEEKSDDVLLLDNPSSYLESPAFLKGINEGTPKLLNRDAAFIKKITGVWIKGNEARVGVELGSRSSEKYLAREDFLLYKKDGEWKIFLVDSPSLINVYGMPEQQ